MTTTITITGSVIDAAGVVFPFSTTATADSGSASAAVVPQVAPAGTARTITVTMTGGIAPFTYGTPTAPGITFTPVSGQPNQWTFSL